MNLRLLVICLVFLFLFMGAGAIQPYLTPYFENNCGMSPSTAGFILALVYITFAAMRFFSGYAVNMIGIKKSIVCGAFLYLVFVTITTFAPSCSLSSASAVLWGIGAALLWTGGSAYILNVSAKNRYGFSVGLQRLFLQAGVIIGFLTLAELIHYNNNYRQGFLVALAACGVGVIVTLFLARTGGKPQPIGFRQVFRDFFDKKLVTASVYLFSTGISYGIILNVFNRFVKSSFGYSSFKYTIVLFYIAGGLSSFIMGALSDKKGRGRTITAGFGCGIAASIIMISSKSLVSLAVSSFLLGVMFQVVPTVVTARIGDISSPSQRPSMVARTFVWRDIGIAFSIQMAGFVTGKASDVTLLFTLFLPVFTLAAIVSLLLIMIQIIFLLKIPKITICKNLVEILLNTSILPIKQHSNHCYYQI